MLARAQQDTVPQRLAAVRHAGACFSDDETLRNEPFEFLLEERSRLLRELEGSRGPLVDALYQAIPTLTEPKSRRRLLKLKRDIFNQRPLGTLPSDLPPDLRPDVELYGLRVDRLTHLYESHRPAILTRSRQRLAALVKNRRFLSALANASPDLFAEVRRGFAAVDENSAGNDTARGFSTTERALYSYAARLFSKANPFHLFAAVQLPGGKEQLSGHELSFEPEGLLALESDLLQGEVSPQDIELCLPPLARSGQSCLFWQATQDGLQVRSCLWSDGLEQVLEYFSRTYGGSLVPGRTTLMGWLQYLERLPAERRERAASVMEALEDQGLLIRYLITDLTDLTPLSKAAMQADEETRQRVAVARKYHLAHVSFEELEHAETVLGELPADVRIRHFVNSYRDDELSPYHQAAESVAVDLWDLKPIFAAHRHNFSLNDTVLSAYIKDYLGTRGGAAPYLEVLTHFLSRKNDILRRYQPQQNEDASLDQRRRRIWHDQLASLDGQIESNTLRDWVGRRPASTSDLAECSLCFNGPYDFQTGTYTVSNVFGGHGHFVSRYHLARSRASCQGLAGLKISETALDVELAVPPVPNLNFVVPAFSTATGMEARYRHRYEHWIEPAEIEFALAAAPTGGDSVVYRRADSEQLLNFHYRGFMLAEFLPAEYQLLLLGHGDTYSNPFLRSEGRPGPGDLRYDPELRYGRVKLRRECWALSFDLLGKAPTDEDPFRFAVNFRDWLHSTLDVAADRWFYRTLGGPAGTYKPRYLDLRNPLGVQAFRRSLARLPKTAALSFTVLDPLPENLLEGRMRELMIEV